MRVPCFLVLFAALSACDSPSPDFMGIDPIPVQVDGSTFSVRVSGNRAEAIRTNTEWAPNLASVAPRAVAAIERASGCRVVDGSVEGDAATVRAALDC